MLKVRQQNKTRNMDQTWVKQTQNRRQAGDIYSFGIVMYEIMFKSMPFPEGTNLTGKLNFLNPVKMIKIY